MSDNKANQSASTPKWFWILGIIAVVWNFMGLFAFALQMIMMRTNEMMAELPKDQQEIYKNMPSWVIACFAIAVVCGVIGSVLLLMRNKLAIPVLILSLIGVLGQYGYMFFMSDTISVMGAAAMILPGIVVLVSIALVPYSLSCKQKGLLS